MLFAHTSAVVGPFLFYQYIATMYFHLAAAVPFHLKTDVSEHFVKSVSFWKQVTTSTNFFFLPILSANCDFYTAILHSQLRLY